jgi:NTE family protein
MKRLISFISACLFLGVSALAQDRSSSTFGLDPKDAQAVRSIQARMGQIRRHRPTVALVLSGGGAKGAATVGALKFIEQYDLPVDMVVGTSIGGLLGSLYSLGYDANYLDSLIHNINWEMALSDKVDRKYVPYSHRRYKEKFLVSIPFFYRTDDYKNFVAGDMPFATSEERMLHLGADEQGTSIDRIVSDNLMGSLPSGFVYGQNVFQIITSRTVGYSDSTDFFKFPIPFACVATDMASGKAKIWHNGSINLAMRSTMSIPGLFTPVRTQGMVLADGGMRNNFPVDIARDMGADIVIGIDLSTGNTESGNINNLADILWQGIDMLAADSYERNVRSVDVRIHPDLEGYNMLSFNEVAIDTMYKRGYRAAMAAAKDLEAVRRKVGSATRKLQARPAVDLNTQSVVIGDIDVVGVTADEAEYIRSKLAVKPGSVVNYAILEKDIAQVFGEGTYDLVNYELRGTMEPYRLRILCKRGPLHQLGLGFRVDSQDLVSILVNVGLNTHAIRGSSLDLTGRLGINPYLDMHYAYNSPRFPTLNLRAFFRWADRNNFVSGDNSYSVAFHQYTQEFFFSRMKWYDFDVQAGIRNHYFNIRQILASDVQGNYDPEAISADYPGFFLNARMETLDNGYFPTRGVSAGIQADYVSRMFVDSHPKPFGSVAMDGQLPVSWGRFTLVPRGSLRFIFGEDIPIVFANVMGGDFPGRYVDQQRPFIGINKAAIRRNYMMLGRLDARVNVAGSHYVSAIFNASYDFNNFGEFEHGEHVLGAGLEYAYNSVLGPLKATLHWSSVTKSVGLYLAVGFNF